MVLEKTPESPLDSKEIKPVNLKGDQPWIFWWWSWSSTIRSSDMQTDNSLEKSLILGKIKGSRRRGHQRMRWMEGISDTMNTNLNKRWGMVRHKEAWPAALYRVANSRTLLGDWTATILSFPDLFLHSTSILLTSFLPPKKPLCPLF